MGACKHYQTSHREPFSRKNCTRCSNFLSFLSSISSGSYPFFQKDPIITPHEIILPSIEDLKQVECCQKHCTRHFDDVELLRNRSAFEKGNQVKTNPTLQNKAKQQNQQPTTNNYKAAKMLLLRLFITSKGGICNFFVSGLLGCRPGTCEKARNMPAYSKNLHQLTGNQ